MPQAPIESRTNPRVKQLRAAFAGQARLSGGLVAIEGENLLYEAMRSGLVFKTIFVSQRVELPEWAPRGVEVIELSDEVFASVMDTRSPQGVAALLVPPAWDLDAVLEQCIAPPLLLLAGGLQDPGNLGTLVRSAEAFGAMAVLTTPGTVSPWNQKAIRASAGSVFRIPTVSYVAEKLVELKMRGVRLCAAVAGECSHGESICITDANLTQACALMVGNEGAGLSEDLLALADEFVTIATPGPVESLNAAIAGSLLLYEASRQRGASKGMPGRQQIATGQ